MLPTLLSGGIAGLVRWLLDKLFKRSPERALGKAEAKLEAQEKADEAKKRMDDTKPADLDEQLNRLRDGDW